MRILRICRGAIRLLNRCPALIRCIEIHLLEGVTLGKVYCVKEVDRDYYVIDDDQGIETAVHKSCFEPVIWR